MRARELVIGESYRIASNPNYGWAKVKEILPPRTGVNPKNKIIVKCYYSVDKDGSFGLIKYFAPVNLVRDNTKSQDNG